MRDGNGDKVDTIGRMSAVFAFVSCAKIDFAGIDDETSLEIISIVDDACAGDDVQSRIDAVVRRCRPGLSDDDVAAVVLDALNAIKKEVLC